MAADYQLEMYVENVRSVDRSVYRFQRASKDQHIPKTNKMCITNTLSSFFYETYYVVMHVQKH